MIDNRKEIREVIARYDKIIDEMGIAMYQEDEPGTSFSHLRWMMHFMNTEEDMPVDKMNRWLGFIQGIMIERKILTVTEERNRTRPLFKKQ